MKRREFVLALAGTALVQPIAVAAQLGDRVRLIGMLMPFGESVRGYAA